MIETGMTEQWWLLDNYPPGVNPTNTAMRMFQNKDDWLVINDVTHQATRSGNPDQHSDEDVPEQRPDGQRVAGQFTAYNSSESGLWTDLNPAPTKSHQYLSDLFFHICSDKSAEMDECQCRLVWKLPNYHSWHLMKLCLRSWSCESWLEARRRLHLCPPGSYHQSAFTWTILTSWLPSKSSWHHPGNVKCESKKNQSDIIHAALATGVFASGTSIQFQQRWMISRSDLISDIWDLTPNLCDSVSSELDEPMMKPKLRIKDTEHQKTTTKRSRTEINDQGSQFEPRVTISELPFNRNSKKAKY